MAATIRLSQQHSCSFDYLVGEREQPIRHVETERLCRSEIDDEFEVGWLHHGEVGRLLAFENSADISAHLVIAAVQVGAIAHQAARLGKFPPRIYRGHAVTRSERDQQLALCR